MDLEKKVSWTIHRQKIVKGFDKANLCLSFGPLKVFLAFFLSPKGSHCERREGWEQVELQKLSLLFVLANRIIGLCCWHEIESIFCEEEKCYQRFDMQRAMAVTVMKNCLHKEDVYHFLKTMMTRLFHSCMLSPFKILGLQAWHRYNSVYLTN